MKDLRDSINDPKYYDYQPKPVAEFVKKNVALYISERQDQFPVWRSFPTYVRDYPQGRRPPTSSATSA